jgi:putative ABC transport system ATP-binding protein
MKENTIIEFKEVKKSYFLTNWIEIPVLKWINLEVKTGEFISLMWESWSWKSTLLNIIWCLHYLTSWKYFFNMEDISHLKDENILSYIRNKKIWFIFQQFNLIPKLTALENVLLPWLYLEKNQNEKIDIALNLLKKVWLKNKANSLPWELSWWQQQRISIARAMMNNPEIILADEPTWALDSNTAIEIMELMTELKNEWKSIIMVTHTPLVAKYSDRIIFLKDWKVIDSDYKLKNI